MSNDKGSGLISLDDMNNDQKVYRFLHGKATKEFVLNETTRIDKDIEMIGEELKRSAVGFSQLFTLQKMLGLQFETMVRMLDTNVPDFRKNFTIEYRRTMLMSQFLDTLNGQGQSSEKPMMEKVDLVRGWNADKENIKIKGAFFGLPDFILSNPTDFTEDQVELLVLEFDCAEIFDQYKSLLAKKDAEVTESVVAGPITEAPPLVLVPPVQE